MAGDDFWMRVRTTSTGDTRLPVGPDRLAA